MTTILGLFDIHYPEYDEKCFNIFKQIAADLKPTHLVFGGDFANCTGISRFTMKDWEDGFLDSIEEIHGFKKNYYKPVISSCNNEDLKIHVLLGNHDGQRFDKLFEKMGEKWSPKKFKLYHDMANFKEIFPEAKVYEYNKICKIGKLDIIHGEYCGSQHTKKHAVEYDNDVMYGHVHTLDVKTVKKKSQNRHVTAYSIPGGMNKNMSYMKGKSSYWLHGCSVTYLSDSGTPYVYPIVIKNGKTIFNGKLYTA